MDEPTDRIDKIEQALEILMAKEKRFWCIEHERWIKNDDSNYSFDYCEDCLRKLD